ncbi:O-antigen ligase family protein [uncultured Psychrosphaera sp.]|uniref:O-antigen ligase family protein n=1 Tax=uncultured Psychrosphaera sp. TaxID=1403522 RepID=UPI0026363D56|nr:O-antigen ligase family protein [uncultured Psychrosphaera sp.]
MSVFYPFFIFLILFSGAFFLAIKSFQILNYLVLLVVILITIISTLKNNIKYKHNAFIYWQLALIVFSAVHSFYFANVTTTIFFYMINVFVVCSIILVAPSTNSFYSDICKCSIYILLLFVIISCASLFLGVETKRFSSFFDNANTYSMNLVFISFFSMCFFIESVLVKKNTYFVSLTILYSFCLYFIILSGSRKTLIFYIALFLYWLFINKRILLSFVQNRFIKLCTQVLIIYTFLTALLWFYNSPFAKRIVGAIAFLSKGTSEEGSINERLNLLSKGIELWSSAPIFGVGFDGFRNLSGFGKYSHNNFIEILANTGVIGSFLYYCFILFLFISIVLFKGQREIKYILLLMFSGLLFFDLTIVSYNNIFFILTYGFIFHRIYNFGGRK